jgi:hypothetical protein
MKRALSKDRALFIYPVMGGLGSNPGSTKWQDSHFGLPTAARRASAMDGASQSRPGQQMMPYNSHHLGTMFHSRFLISNPDSD